MAYAYRDIDKATLAKYEGFVAQTAYQKLNDAVLSGFSEGYKVVVSDLAKDLAESLKPEEKAET